MAVHYRTQGIIIKKTDRGEADQLLTIFTEDFGKLEILGKALRKIQSKLKGGTQLFSLSEIEFIQGKARKTLTDSAPIENFKNIKNDPESLTIAHQIAQTADDLILMEEKDAEIWKLFREMFEKLDQLKKPELIYYYFFWNLVSILGYYPEINKFSVAGKKIDADIFKILKLIFEKNWQILSKLKLDSSHFKLLKDLSEWYNKEVIP